MQTSTNEYKATIQELNNQLKDFKNAIEEQRQQVQKESDQRANFQERLKDAEKFIEELKAKNNELENSRPNPGTGYKSAISIIIKSSLSCNQIEYFTHQ